MSFILRSSLKSMLLALESRSFNFDPQVFDTFDIFEI